MTPTAAKQANTPTIGKRLAKETIKTHALILQMLHEVPEGGIDEAVAIERHAETIIDEINHRKFATTKQLASMQEMLDRLMIWTK